MSSCLGNFNRKAPAISPRSRAKFRNALGALIIYPFILCLPIFRCYIEHSSSPSKIRHNYNFEALEESAKEGGEGSH